MSELRLPPLAPASVEHGILKVRKLLPSYAPHYTTPSDEELGFFPALISCSPHSLTLFGVGGGAETTD